MLPQYRQVAFHRAIADECSLRVLTIQHVIPHQRVDRLSKRRTADPKTPPQHILCRQLIARLQAEIGDQSD
jgi:hypothetical protein